MLQEFNFTAGEKGPKVLILGAIHGNETAGPLACKKLVREFKEGKIKLLKGELVLVPVCNPEANKKDVRQIEENLNRVVKIWNSPETYEQKLGVEVAEKIETCDYLLDLHSTHNAGEVPFSFLDYPTEGNLEIVDALDVGFILTGWPEIYGSQDSISDFSTETYAHVSGKNGVTLECGYHKDIGAQEVAYNSVMNLLKKLGMVKGDFTMKNKKIVKMTDIIIKEKEGKLTQKFKHFDFVSKGTVIAVCDDGEELKASKDCFMIIPNHNAEIGAEWYYLGEEA